MSPGTTLADGGAPPGFGAPGGPPGFGAPGGISTAGGAAGALAGARVAWASLTRGSVARGLHRQVGLVAQMFGRDRDQRAVKLEEQRTPEQGQG